MDVRHVSGCKAFNSEKMNKVNLFETDRMFCDLYCFEPGQQQTVHAHAGSDKVYYVLEGCGTCLLYTSPSPRDGLLSRMPSSA